LILFSNLDAVAQETRPGGIIDYQPFFPDRWKQKRQSTRMYPWEGERVVLLTTTSDFDGKVMARFLQRLDAGWRLYAEMIGRLPKPNRQHHGKVTIAAVPDASYTCGIGCGYNGMTGIEVGGFYSGDYRLVAGQPDAFPHYYFYEMGRNYYLFGDQMRDFGTGFAVFMRYVCMDTVKCDDPDQRTREAIEKAEAKLRDTNLTFSQAFTTSTGLSEKAPRLRDLSPSDQPVMYASAMLRMRREYGGNEWVKRFFRYLAQCPPAGADSEDSARAQSLNWLVAASCAARQDLSSLFVDCWRMPLGAEAREAFRAVDWRADDVSPRQIIASLPADELPLTYAVNMPGYLTPERRRANLLMDASFEKGTLGCWSIMSWRQNKAAVKTVSDGAKEGTNAIEIRTANADDAKYVQKVAVKPRTRYLLSGWIKTKDVAVVEKGGRTGANLSIDGGYEASTSLAGTNDWTYVVLVFNSANRTDVTVCARLGFFYSTAKGTAWFDDLSLVEIPRAARRSANR